MAAWHGAGLATPLVLGVEEFALARRVSLRVWRDPQITSSCPARTARGSQGRSGYLRQACEVQARSHLLHLREGYLETRGRSDALAELLSRSMAPSPRLARALPGFRATAPATRAAAAAVERASPFLRERLPPRQPVGRLAVFRRGPSDLPWLSRRGRTLDAIHRSLERGWAISHVRRGPFVVRRTAFGATRRSVACCSGACLGSARGTCRSPHRRCRRSSAPGAHAAGQRLRQRHRRRAGAAADQLSRALKAASGTRSSSQSSDD